MNRAGVYRKDNHLKDLALLMLRITTGGLVAGHGAQKLFGSFDGPGLEGFGGFLESMGMKPGKLWAMLGGLSEFGGGILTALGLLSPLGPLGIIGAMSVATFKAHTIRPIFAQDGGAELPVTNTVIASAIVLSGPGRYSFDRALGLRVPRWLVVLFLLFGIVTAAVGASATPEGESEDSEPDAEGEA